MAIDDLTIEEKLRLHEAQSTIEYANTHADLIIATKHFRNAEGYEEVNASLLSVYAAIDALTWVLVEPIT